MIIVLLLIAVGAVGTVLVCKSISAGFDTKNEMITEMEKSLNEEQKELRLRRRELKRELENLKRDLKSNNTRKDTAPSAPSSLQDWLIDTELVGMGQYKKAERYAKEKNLDMISALLTLNMITVDTYEKAKKMKLR
ncbi:hypothetical protein [Maridesulfovibrio sp.]|uniref:hypothetical protein n=1 Tax=Maridesulfovibrio sp. TaxID=2795000 RepID=UPI002A18C6A4|nr:hypothetical protein [Maridesulfovibrio sp.]